MKKITRVAVVGLLLLLLVGLAGWGYLQYILPTKNGSINTSLVQQDTEVVTDRWGIPHIRAKNAHDAYFALGFTMAQDRFFQMDMQRRVALGELSELLGPSTVKVDKMFRTLLIKQQAEEYLNQPSGTNTKALNYLDAFLQGINYFISHEKLPLEYKILNSEPRPFTRLDSLASMGYVAYTFGQGIKRDSLYSKLLSQLGEKDMKVLYPDYLQENHTTIMQPNVNALSNSTEQHRLSKTAQLNLVRLHQYWQQIFDQANDVVPAITGSNSWVIAPSRSESGSALLANDPHVSVSNPGTWYEAQISYPGYDNYGHHLALMPFPLLGQTNNKAWALTMFENDDMDLYAETFNPNNQEQVRFKGEWVKIKTYTEQIKVKGEKPQSVTIRVTPHGPIISDYIKGYAGKPVSLSWTYLNVANPVLDVLYGMSYSKNLTEFRQAISKLAAPGLNISYIDKQGNIAWWAAAKVVVRADGVKGKKILDGGSGKDEIQGYLPFSSNPHLVNPKSGIIVTANNLPTAEPTPPIGLIPGYYAPSDRASRIHQLLDTKSKWNLSELKAIQTDMVMTQSLRMSQYMVSILQQQEKGFSKQEIEALKALQQWNGEYTLNSVGPIVFEFTTYRLLQGLLGNKLDSEELRRYLNLSDHWNFLKSYLKPSANGAFENTDLSTEPKSTVILRAFKQAVAEIVRKKGDDTENWQWGKVHWVEFAHPLGKVKPLNLLFNLGPYPAPSGYQAINKFKSRKGNHDYRAVSIPSTRRLVSFASNEPSWSILPTGNSGNVMSKHYSDQVDIYLHNKYREIFNTRAQLEKNTESVLTFTPSSSK